MKADNLIQQKTFAFSIRVINAFKFLKFKKQKYILSKQLLRSGTSIGANIEEAIGAQSKPDFLSKLSVSYKEARETVYWIRLLQATDYLSQQMVESLKKDAEEICRIIAKILLTSKQN